MKYKIGTLFKGGGVYFDPNRISPYPGQPENAQTPIL